MKNKSILILMASVLFMSGCKENSEGETTAEIEPFQYDDGDVVKRGYLDKSGNMWFATTREGVFKYDGKTFTNISTKDGLCSDMVDAIIEDDNGLMWFGT
ncbi:MAG: hypothetical protein OTJ44_08245, partial [Planctomycetota bacterium]|nr:hypothetical protein [Planctomycetota bacterium]